VITLDEYFTNPTTGEVKPHTPDQRAAAEDLIERVIALCAHVMWHWPESPHTGTCISGSKGGAGDGGFRAANSKTGGPGSRHRRAMAVDVYDPGGSLNKRIDDEMLERHGLYREHPSATPTWCHLETGGPKSGRRTFYP